MMSAVRDDAIGASADAQVLAQVLDWFEKPDAPVGPFTPPALSGAFDVFAAAAFSPSQMRTVERVFDQALAEIFQHVLRYHPGDLGVLAKHLWHLKSEPVSEPAAPLVGSAP